MNGQPLNSLAEVRRYRGESAPHAHAVPVLGVVLGGRYRERIRGRESEHGPGHALFCPAFEPHGQTFGDEVVVKVLFTPDAPTLDYLAARLRLDEAPYAAANDFAPLGRRIAGELRGGDAFSPLVVQGLSLEIAALFAREAVRRDDPVPAWLRKTRAQIEADPCTCSLHALARDAGRHPATLARGFRAAFGLSVGEYARRARLRTAVRLLEATGWTLADIALECGFCDQAHLTRSFKAAYGIAPSALASLRLTSKPRRTSKTAAARVVIWRMMTPVRLSLLSLIAAPIAAIALASPAAAAEAPSFDRVAWKADFEYLKAQAEAQYVNLAWDGSPQSGDDLPTLNRRTLKALDDAQNDADAQRAILDFLAGFHDGHFSRLTTLAPATQPLPEPAEAALDPDDPATGCAALGYASTVRVPFSYPFESLPGFKLEGDGLTSVYRAGTFPDPKGGRVGVVRIQAFRALAFPAICPALWASLKAQGKTITHTTMNDAVDDAWFAALAAQLARFRAEGVKAVLVDIGSNSGGNDSGDEMVRLFTDRPVKSAKMLVVAAPIGARYFDEEIHDLRAGESTAATPQAKAALEAAAKDFERRKVLIATSGCDLSWVWREQRAWSLKACNRTVDAGSSGGASDGLAANAFGDPKSEGLISWPSQFQKYWGAWTGPVYVLANATSYSSAEMFAARMKDNGVAKLIGARTGGDGCGFVTDGDPVVLPHSRLRFRMPNCIRLRADGTDEVAGVAPDVPITPVEGASQRALANAVVTAISADLSSQASTRQ